MLQCCILCIYIVSYLCIHVKTNLKIARCKPQFTEATIKPKNYHEKSYSTRKIIAFYTSTVYCFVTVCFPCLKLHTYKWLATEWCFLCLFCSSVVTVMHATSKSGLLLVRKTKEKMQIPCGTFCEENLNMTNKYRKMSNLS